MTGDVEALYFALLDAWNQRDAAAMSTLYAKDGVQIGFDGSSADGRVQIREHLASIFRDHRTALFVAKVRECRTIGADAAMLTAVAGMLQLEKDQINPDTNTLQTLVASRADGG